MEQRFSGRIAGVGSTSGTRVVIGWWRDSPFGTFADFTTYGGGLYDLCAVRMNGELWCAGAGDRGQLGADLVGWTPAPVAVPCD